MVRKVQDRLAGFRLPWGRRQPVKEKRALWIPALATACVLVLVAIFIGYERSGTIEQPVAQRIDISQKLPENEEEIVKNLDLLKNFNTLEKLSQVVDDSAGRNPSETHNQGRRGKSGMATMSALLRRARCLIRCCGILSFIAVLVFALASAAWCTSRNGPQTDIQGHRFRVPE